MCKDIKKELMQQINAAIYYIYVWEADVAEYWWIGHLRLYALSIIFGRIFGIMNTLL